MGKCIERYTARKVSVKIEPIYLENEVVERALNRMDINQSVDDLQKQYMSYKVI